MKKSNQIISLMFYLIIFLFLNGCCFPGSETQISDDGIILWQGSFPDDFNEQDPIERKNAVLVTVKNKSGYVGSLESRNKNRKLVFVNAKGKEKELWKYVDYGGVKKITFSESENILRIYYNQALMGIRLKKYALEFQIDTMEKKTLLLECGKWYL